MPANLVPCACCKEKTPTVDLHRVACIGGYVCRECRRDLHNAESALYEAGIPPIHRGPFSGNSIG